MFSLITSVLVGLSMQAVASLPASAPTDVPTFTAVLAAQDEARRSLYEAIAPSIVSVTSYVKVPDDAPREGRWAIADESPYPGFARHLVASGILLDDQGTILCCRTPLTLERDVCAPLVDVENSAGTRYEAELIASEPTINLAILRIRLEGGRVLEGMRPATIGRTASIRPGDTVFAVGDPYGASRTFAPGVVMALPTAACYQSDLNGSFIHCSMTISPGAVGGALVNTAGEVVGMLVPPPSLDPLARPDPHPYDTFAMQVETAVGVGEALRAKRSNDSPWLGFSVLAQEELRVQLHDDAAFAALRKPARGLYVHDLYEPSPASKAGVRHGDFVVEVNGRPIESVVDFQQALYYFSGSSVPIRFVRNGEERTLVMRIERRPPEANRQ